MGDDNPVQNDKLLREAYEAGRSQALNEQGMPPQMTQMPMNSMGTPVPPQNRMGMGARGRGSIRMNARGSGRGPIPGNTVPEIPPGKNVEDFFPGGIYEYPAGSGQFITPVPELEPGPLPEGSQYRQMPPGRGWGVYDSEGNLTHIYNVPYGWLPVGQSGG